MTEPRAFEKWCEQEGVGEHPDDREPWLACFAAGRSEGMTEALGLCGKCYYAKTAALAASAKGEA